MLHIFLTDLAAYNKGYLYGKWITLPCDNLQEEVESILKAGEELCLRKCSYYEEHEEWFITDYEWKNVALFDIDEYSDIYKLNQEMNLLDGLDKDTLKAIAFLLQQNIVTTLDDALNGVDDVIVHSGQTLTDVAYELIQECYEVDKLPSIISNNIDYKAIANELRHDGRYFEQQFDVIEYIG